MEREASEKDHHKTAKQEMFEKYPQLVQNRLKNTRWFQTSEEPRRWTVADLISCKTFKAEPDRAATSNSEKYMGDDGRLA
jgi:hypothetical protein